MSEGEPLDLDEAAMEEALREAEAIADQLEETKDEPATTAPEEDSV